MEKACNEYFCYKDQDIKSLNSRIRTSDEKIYSDSFLNTIAYKTNKIVFKNKDVDFKKTILVVGSPRSGTTILEEVLCSLKDYTYLFEPLNPRQYPDSIKAGFTARSSYIDPEKNSESFSRYLNCIFRGKVYDRYIPISPRFELLLKRLICNNIVVKSVRMNRLIPWIEKRFKLRHTFLVIRHPCAVVASQLRTTFTGYHDTKYPYIRYFPNRKQILQEASKIINLDENIYKKLRLIEKPEEILAAAWCLDLFVPFKENNYSNRSYVFYENLISYKKKEIEKIFKTLNEKPSKLTYKFLNKPSITTHQRDPKKVIDVNNQLTKWKDILSEEQIDRILNIANIFNFTFYNKDYLPRFKEI